MKKFMMTFTLAAGLMSVPVLAAPSSDAAYQAITQGHWTEAETLLRQDLAQNPNDAARLLDLAYVLRNTGRPTEAIGVYQRVLRLNSDPVVAVDDADTSTKSSDAKRVAKSGIASLDWAKR